MIYSSIKKKNELMLLALPLNILPIIYLQKKRNSNFVWIKIAFVYKQGNSLNVFLFIKFLHCLGCFFLFKQDFSFSGQVVVYEVIYNLGSFAQLTINRSIVLCSINIFFRCEFDAAQKEQGLSYLNKSRAKFKEVKKNHH